MPPPDDWFIRSAHVNTGPYVTVTFGNNHQRRNPSRRPFRHFLKNVEFQKLIKLYIHLLSQPERESAYMLRHRLHRFTNSACATVLVFLSNITVRSSTVNTVCLKKDQRAAGLAPRRRKNKLRVPIVQNKNNFTYHRLYERLVIGVVSSLLFRNCLMLLL